MRFLYVFLTISISLWSFTAIGQSKAEAAIQKDFATYTQTIIDKDYEKSMDYTAPAIFKIIDREALLQQFTAIMNNPGLEIKTGASTIATTQDLSMVGDTAYVLFDYGQKMQFKYLDVVVEEVTDETPGVTRRQLTDQMKLQFGDENVTFNPATEFYTIIDNKKALAIKPATGDRWKFIVIQPGAQVMMQQILPDTIIKEIYP
jgi:hypothetical protein